MLATMVARVAPGVRTAGADLPPHHPVRTQRLHLQYRGHRCRAVNYITSLRFVCLKWCFGDLNLLMQLIFFLVAQQLYTSPCFFFVLYFLSHPSKYEHTSQQTNSQVYIQSHKTILDLMWLNVLRNSCTIPYLFFNLYLFLQLLSSYISICRPHHRLSPRAGQSAALAIAGFSFATVIANFFEFRNRVRACTRHFLSYFWNFFANHNNIILFFKCSCANMNDQCALRRKQNRSGLLWPEIHTKGFSHFLIGGCA